MREKKSLEMKNFIFKSKDNTSDLLKILVNLEMIKSEQRHVRGDLQTIKKNLVTLIDSIQETSPQTDSDTRDEVPEQELV